MKNMGRIVMMETAPRKVEIRAVMAMATALSRVQRRITTPVRKRTIASSSKEGIDTMNASMFHSFQLSKQI